MSEPLKPRIDFAEPLQGRSLRRPSKRSKLSAKRSRGTFAPGVAIDEPPEDEGAAEAAVDAALRLKRSLWRKNGDGRAGAVWRERGRARRTVDNECPANSGLVAFRRIVPQAR